MPKPGDFIIVHLVDKCSVGMQFERARMEWPLHITLASWFELSSVENLRVELGKVARETQLFTATVGRQVLFGAQANVPVNIIDEQDTIKRLHEALVSVVNSSDGIFEHSRWMDNGYKAHITQHDNHLRHEGDKVEVVDFHLIRLLPPNTCEVIEQFLLGKHHEATA